MVKIMRWLDRKVKIEKNPLKKGFFMHRMGEMLLIQGYRRGLHRKGLAPG